MDLMKKMEEQFKSGCVEHSGMDPQKVSKLWEDIVRFAEYSFNKSHAAAYALISYRTAYLKKYYPVEFYAATISSSVGNPDKLSFYLDSARKECIDILVPDINTSQESFSVVEAEAKEGKRRKVIRVGLSGIKNVGGEAVKSILANRPYEDYQDFINRVDLSKVNKRVCHSLISVGCFDELGINRASLLDAYMNVQKTDGKEKQLTLFGGVANEIKCSDLPPMSLGEKLKLEEDLLGICISGHIMDTFGKYGNGAVELNNLKHDVEAEVFGVVKRYTRIVTKNGADMAFMDISDRSGECRVTIFPRDFEEHLMGQKVDEGDAVLLSGKFVENKDFGDAFIANNVRVVKAEKIEAK
jgi:DNA polymerase-3 subunit alpha